MVGPAQLAPGRATIVLVLVVLSVPALGVATYWYVTDEQTAEQYYLKASFGLFLDAILLYQLAPSFSGRAVEGVKALSYVAGIGFLAMSLQRWRYRGTEESHTSE